MSLCISMAVIRCILCMCCLCDVFFFCKQKTAYEMRISDWSSDVCSSDLRSALVAGASGLVGRQVVARLLRDPAYAQVCVLTRRPLDIKDQIGRASCRERVCQYV